MLSEPPDADPHVWWCGERRGEPGAYPIRRGSICERSSSLPPTELVLSPVTERGPRSRRGACFATDARARAGDPARLLPREWGMPLEPPTSDRLDALVWVRFGGNCDLDGSVEQHRATVIAHLGADRGRGDATGRGAGKTCVMHRHF
jgi:hypothetical protein